MTSRMDRYYKEKLISAGRIEKNKKLYDKIKDYDGYTNIEGIKTLNNEKEIDISMVRDLIEDREKNKKKRYLNSIMDVEKTTEEKNFSSEQEEIRKRDISELLVDIVQDDDKKFRRLNDLQYNLIKNIKDSKKKYELEDEEKELKELIKTMTSMKPIDVSSVNENSGLLDDLMSDTEVGSATSINKILNDEKNKKNNEIERAIDRSFYSDTMGFTAKDLENINDLNKNIKKSNKFAKIMIILLIIIIIIITIAVIVFRH